MESRESAGQLPPDKVKKIKKFLIQKRIIRLKGAVRTQVYFAKRLRRMRAFRKFRMAGAVVTIAQKTMFRRLYLLRRKRGAMVLQAYLRAYLAVKEFRDMLNKREASEMIFDWFKRHHSRQLLVREIKKRVEKKLSAKEAERRAKEEREREEVS